MAAFSPATSPIDLNDYPTGCVCAAFSVELGSSYANMTPVIAKPVKQ